VLSPKNQSFDLKFQGQTIHLMPAGTVETGAAEDSRVYISLADSFLDCSAALDD